MLLDDMTLPSYPLNQKILAALVLLNACTAALPRGGRTVNANPIISAIDAVALISTIDPTARLVRRGLTELGVGHVFDTKGGTFELCVALYADESLAHRALAQLALFTSVAPEDTSSALGDERRIWQRGTIAFRRANSVIRITGWRTFAENRVLANEFDRALLTSPAVHHDMPLRLPHVTLPFPKDVAAGSTTTVRIELDPPDAFVVATASNGEVRTAPGPTVTYYAPRSSGSQSIVLISATSGNLTTEQSFPIHVH